MGLLSKAITANPPGFRPGQAAQVPAGTEGVRDMIRGYWLRNPSCQGIVLELPEHARRDCSPEAGFKEVSFQEAGFQESGFEMFFGTAASLVASFGRAVRLPSKNILILFSKAGDRELLTHRLVKSLRTRVLASFEADSPGEVLSRIKSCL
jgi:hypothetical protein